MSEYDSSASFYIKPNSEPTSIGIVANITLKDDRRNREVPVRVSYPLEQGSFPVIIFSHGTGGSKESFSYLSSFWTSYGYICIHPTHAGSDFSVLQKIGLQALLERTNEPQSWLERPQDISFLIDSLEELEQQIPQIRGKINPSFIGVAGHSYGAYTTMLVAGATIMMPWGEEVSCRDDRTCGFLAISPPGTNRQGLNEGSWDKIDTSMMTVSGSKDQGWEGEPASWRMEAFKYMPPGEKFHVLVKGATHFSFDPDVSLARTPYQRMNRGNNIPRARNLLELDSKRLIKIYLQSASTAFWDTSLKFKKTGREYLLSEELPTYSNGDVTIFLK